MPPERRSQLIALLRRLGLEPTAGPADTASGAALASDAVAGDAVIGDAAGLAVHPAGRSEALQQTCSRRLELVDEALTHTSACLPRNHEALEFLGDAVLRLAAAAFLQREQPQLSVGQRSSLRAQLVSDRWLADLAERLELIEVLRIGPVAAGDRAGRATLLAECCEALVGAVYEGWGGADGGLRAVHRWLDPHWQAGSAALLADPLRHNWKSALQEWSQGRRRGLPEYRSEERSRAHGDPRRFHCRLRLLPAMHDRDGQALEAEGWGGSRREAEQQAARAALEILGIGGAVEASIEHRR